MTTVAPVIAEDGWSAALRRFVDERGRVHGDGRQSFTTDAKAEATRDGAPPIDLIDGDRLSDLLKQHGLNRRAGLLGCTQEPTRSDRRTLRTPS